MKNMRLWALVYTLSLSLSVRLLQLGFFTNNLFQISSVSYFRMKGPMALFILFGSFTWLS